MSYLSEVTGHVLLGATCFLHLTQIQKNHKRLLKVYIILITITEI